MTAEAQVNWIPDTATFGARLALAATAVMLALTGCTAAPTQPVERERINYTHTVTFAAVGDSITALYANDGTPRGELSWVNWASTSKVIHTGGYAESGMTSIEMWTNMVAPFTADVLVIMAGTNDVMKYVPTETSLTYIDDIIARSGIRTVVVSAIAPTDRDPAAALEYNAALAAHVNVHGWMFVDPWVQFRNPDGTWVAGCSYDQFHPTGATQSVVGSVLRDAIVNAEIAPAQPL